MPARNEPPGEIPGRSCERLQANWHMNENLSFSSQGSDWDAGPELRTSPFGAATSGFAPSCAGGAPRPFRLPSLTQGAGAGMLAAGKGWVLAILAMLAQAGCAWLRVAPVPASPPWPFAVLPAALMASGRGASRQQSTPKMACRPGVEQGAMESKKQAIAKQSHVLPIEINVLR